MLDLKVVKINSKIIISILKSQFLNLNLWHTLYYCFHVTKTLVFRHTFLCVFVIFTFILFFKRKHQKCRSRISAWIWVTFFLMKSFSCKKKLILTKMFCLLFLNSSNLFEWKKYKINIILSQRRYFGGNLKR